MRLCFMLDAGLFPPSHVPMEGVVRVALPWEVVAEHVRPRDLSGASLMRAMEAGGGELAYVFLPALDCVDEATFERQTDDAYMRMQVASRLGAEGVVLSSAHDSAAGFATLVDAVTRLAALAERMELSLLLRNALGSVLEQPEALGDLLQRVRSPQVGICLDALAFHRAAVNPADMPARFAARLGAVQIAGAVQMAGAVQIADERDGLPCDPGEGVGHVQPLLSALRAEGFCGDVVVDFAWRAQAAEMLVRA